MPLDNPVLILLDQRLVALKKKKKQPFTLTKKSKHLLQIAVQAFQSQKERKEQ